MTKRMILVLSLALSLLGCGAGSHDHGEDPHNHAGGEEAHHHHGGEHHDHDGADGEHHHHEGEHHDHADADGEHHHHGEEHHAHEGDEAGHGHHEHGEMHPALRAYHDVLAPAWHAEAGEARVAASCEASPQLVERAGPLGDAMTAHQTEAGAASPDAAAEALATAAAGLAESCAGEPPDGAAVETAIADVHERFHTIMEALRGE